MNRIGAGALGGFLATVPMTAVMFYWHRRLLRREQYPLPPHEITAKLAQEAGQGHRVNELEHDAATWVSHFAYGTAKGGLYGTFQESIPAPPALKGAAYGLAVWAGNYLGLLPALGILRPATEHPARRNALMITAHLVWGACLGLVADEGRPPRGTHGVVTGEPMAVMGVHDGGSLAGKESSEASSTWLSV
jgi:putative membrane protein